jgi:hypothetical protein
MWEKIIASIKSLALGRQQFLGPSSVPLNRNLIRSESIAMRAVAIFLVAIAYTGAAWAGQSASCNNASLESRGAPLLIYDSDHDSECNRTVGLQER